MQYSKALQKKKRKKNYSGPKELNFGEESGLDLEGESGFAGEPSSKTSASLFSLIWF